MDFKVLTFLLSSHKGWDYRGVPPHLMSVVLRFGTKASYMQGKYFTNWYTSPALRITP